MSAYIPTALINFQTYKSLAEKAISQLNESDLYKTLAADSNSIAIIMQHMIGNARSRFVDFFTSDGEKKDRNRDQEFINKNWSKNELLVEWEMAWKIVFDLLNSMNEEDLSRTVSIRGEQQTALKAINRQIAHYAYHVGQIVFLAKHWKGKEWDTLSIAKGKSDEYNQGMKTN